ncbi:MAG: hypothetical protein V1742_11620 [Pseudomonadota bacterium]
MIFILVGAHAAASVSQTNSRFTKAFTYIFLVLAVLGLLFLGGAAFYYEKDIQLVPIEVVLYFESLFLISGLGMGLTFFLARASKYGTVVASGWSRSKIWVAMILTVGTVIMTWMFTDLNRQTDLLLIRNETTSEALRLLPPRVSQDQNAALLYDRAALILGDWKELPSWFIDSERADFDPASPEAVKFLKDNARVLNLVYRASTLPYFYVPVDVNNIISTLMPNFLKDRNRSKFMSLQARSRAKEGDLAGAIKDLAVMNRMTQHLQEQPGMLPLMYSFAMDSSRIKTLEYILAAAPEATADWITLPVHVSKSMRHELRESLFIERTASLQVFSIIGLDTSKELDIFNYGFIRSFWRVFLFPNDVASTRRQFDEWLRWVDRPYYKVSRQIMAMRDLMEKKPSGYLTSFFYISYERLMLNTAQRDAQRGLSELALAITAYKAAEGKYPPTLNSLVPQYMAELPLDPFDGTPLKAKILEGGLDLFAQGPGKDEPTLYSLKGPIHFYLGQAVYQKYRVEPAIKESQERQKQKKK